MRSITISVPPARTSWIFGHRVSVLARVRDRARLAFDHAAALGAPQHEAGSELEDVAVASAREQPAGLDRSRLHDA